MSHPSELNRRVEVENILLMMAQGRRQLPDQKECRILALKLGIPKRHWPEQCRKHK